jgi:hypothetical protein
MGINHYTTLFVQESQNEAAFLIGTGVNFIQDDKYPVAASAWIQVRYIYIYIYIYIYMCVCVCVYV